MRDLRLLARRHLGQDIADLPVAEAMELAEDAVAMQKLAIQETSQAIIKAWNAIHG